MGRKTLNSISLGPGLLGLNEDKTREAYHVDWLHICALVILLLGHFWLPGATQNLCGENPAGGRGVKILDHFRKEGSF